MATERDEGSGRRHPRVANLSEVEVKRVEHGKRFASSSKWLAGATGARAIGCTWYEVAPGLTAWPYHYHCANEEAVFILEGRGTVRLGEERIEVTAGDYICFPTGPDLPHQLINTGDVPLRYLCLSTLITTEVVGYPDSKKIGARAYASDPARPALVRMTFETETEVEYWTGEPVD